MTPALPELTEAVLVGCQLDRSELSPALGPGEVAVTRFSGGHRLLGVPTASLLCGWDRSSHTAVGTVGEGWGAACRASAKVSRAGHRPASEGKGK